MVELSWGTFPSNTPCGLGQGIAVNVRETVAIDLDPSFNETLNAFTNCIRDARYEVNFAATAGSTVRYPFQPFSPLLMAEVAVFISMTLLKEQC